MSDDSQQRDRLLKIVDEINLGPVFAQPGDKDVLFGKLKAFGDAYGQHLGRNKAGLPATASLGDILDEHNRNPHRVHMLLEALAFNCTADILAMVWMTLLGARIDSLSYTYRRAEQSALKVALSLPDHISTLTFESTDHWDAAVLRFATLAKTGGKPVIDGLFPIWIRPQGSSGALAK
jgi:hypothetical protein